MNKHLIMLATLLAFFFTAATAHVSVSDAERLQIVENVLSEVGFYDAMEVEKRARLAALEQDMPLVTGNIIEQGSCLSYPCPVPAAYAGLQGDLASTPDISGIKGIKDVNGNNYRKFSPKISSYDYITSGGTDALLNYQLFMTWQDPNASTNPGRYAVVDIQPEFYQDNQPPILQFIHINASDISAYTFNARARYYSENLISKTNNKSSNTYYSYWSFDTVVNVVADTMTVGDLSPGALKTCLTDANNQYTDSMPLMDVEQLVCDNYGLNSDDRLTIRDYMGGLRKLNLSNNPGITTYGGFGTLSFLSWLDLSGNPISAFGHLYKFGQVDTFVYRNSGSTEVPRGPKNATFLDYSGNHFATAINVLNEPDRDKSIQALNLSIDPQLTPVTNFEGDLLAALSGQYVKALDLSGHKINDINAFSAVNDLWYLTLNDVDFSGNVDGELEVSSFKGLCSLAANETNLKGVDVIIENLPDAWSLDRTPIQYLSLQNNPAMKRIIPLHTSSYKPHWISLKDSEALKCHNYYDYMDLWNNSSVMHLTDIQWPIATLPGSENPLPSCLVPNTQPVFVKANDCLMNAVQSVSVFEDDITETRQVTWIINPTLHETYQRWGVTHHEIRAYDNNDQVIQRKSVGIDDPNQHAWFYTHNAVKYGVAACNATLCGWERLKLEVDFKLGLTKAIDTQAIWDTSDLNEIKVNVHFDYPNPATADAEPDHFVLYTGFGELGNSDELLMQIQANYGGGTISGNSKVFSGISQTDLLGSTLHIYACRVDRGCGPVAQLSLTAPLTSNDIESPVIMEISSMGQYHDTIHMNWQLGVTGMGLVDYVEIIEEQPVVSALKLADNAPPSNTTTEVKKYALETQGQFGSVELKRAAKGIYTFTMRACHAREEGDVCSEPSSVIKHHGRNVAGNIPNPNFTQLYSTYNNNPTSPGFGTSDIRFLYNSSSPNNTRYPDYFYFNKVDPSQPGECIIPHYEGQIPDPNTPDDQTSVESFFFWTHGVATTTHSIKKYCQISTTHTTWSVQACFAGLGCAAPSEITVCPADDLNCAPNQPTTIVSEISEPGFQGSVNPGGPGDLAPGHFWNENLSGTGWQFHWATQMDSYDEVNQRIDHGVTYDLIAYWFAYAPGDDGTWTPTWFKSKLQRQENEDFFEGELSYYYRDVSSGASEIKSEILGSMQVHFNVVSNSNQHAKILLDFDADYMMTLLEMELPASEYLNVNGQYEFYLEDANIQLVGNNPGAFGTGNDDDHYTGVWSHITGTNTDPELTFISDIYLNYEYAWLAFFDNTPGNIHRPMWAVGSNCDGGDDSFCQGVPGSGYFEDYINNVDGTSVTGPNDPDYRNFYTINEGYNPLSNRPASFNVDDEGRFVGHVGRCFDVNNDEFSGTLYAKIDIDSDLIEGRVANFEVGRRDCVSDPGQGAAGLDKTAGIHFITFDVNIENRIEDPLQPNKLICDLNGNSGYPNPGYCAINFDWFTDDDFPSVRPFVNSGTGWYQLQDSPDFSNCSPALTDDHLRKDYQCFTEIQGDYEFELRKPSYHNANNWETVAKSRLSLEVLPCSSMNCEGNIPEAPVEVQDPVIAGTADLIDHQPGDGPTPGAGSTSGGSASYQLPISVPPGVNGMTPELTLSYSSKGGQNELGMGWSHSLNSGIQRCPKTRAQDDKYHPVDFSNKDRLCLNGQRLILITSEDTGDADSDTAYWSNGAEFRTEIESFSRINLFKSGDDISIKVFTKAGRIEDFSQLGGQQMAWQLVKVTDTFGNFIDYEYLLPEPTNTLGINEVLLYQVIYTGHNSTPGTRMVQFNYAYDDAQYRISYHFGELYEATQKLTDIQTKINGQVVRTYHINYGASEATGRLLLTSVDEEVGNITRTLFDAEWTDAGWQAASQSITQYINLKDAIGSHFTSGVLPRNMTNLSPGLDYNGDGIKDMTYGPKTQRQPSGSGIVFMADAGSAQPVKHVVKDIGRGNLNKLGPGDINGDGINDLLVYDEETALLNFYQWKIGSEFTQGSNNANQYFDEVLLDLGLSDTVMDDLNIWGSIQKFCGDHRKLEFDETASQFFIRDYDRDGKDDILVLAHVKEGGSSNQECRWDGLDRYAIKSKLLMFRNNSSHTNPDAITGLVEFQPTFQPPVVLMGDLEPLFDREDEAGGIQFHIYDKLESIEDFNGDGLLDYEIKRMVKWRWFYSDAPIVPIIADHNIYFTTSELNNLQPPTKKSLVDMGLIDFYCDKITRDPDTNQIISVDSVLCGGDDYESTSFGPNAITFQDVNNDGLKDLLYYDRAIRTGDDFNHDIQRSWKVRLNKGGNIDFPIFESASIVDPSVIGSELVHRFLPQGNVCQNLGSVTDRSVFRACNFVFRAAGKFADIDADGYSEYLYPNPNPDDLVFNRCMIPAGATTGFNQTSQVGEVCAANEPTFSENGGTGFTDEALCYDLAGDQVFDHLGRSDQDPFVSNQLAQHILNNEADYFGSQGADCLAGTCNDPNFQEPAYPESPTSGSGPASHFACSSGLIGNDPNYLDLYENAATLDALWDRGVYEYQALDFRLNPLGGLTVMEDLDTGIYATLFWGSAADHNGDGLGDFYAPIGCMGEPAGYELIGCSNDSSEVDWTSPLLQESGLTSANFFDLKGHHILMKRDQVHMPDMIQRITKPLAKNDPALVQVFEWDYAPISQDLTGQPGRNGLPLYQIPDNSCEDGGGECFDGYINSPGVQDEYHYFNSSMYVVSQMRQSNGLLNSANDAQMARTTYGYQEAIYNNQGRGFQGFHKIKALQEPLAGLNYQTTTNESTFHQVFPLSGNLITSRMTDGQGQKIKETRYVWNFQNKADNAYPSDRIQFRPLFSQTTDYFDIQEAKTKTEALSFVSELCDVNSWDVYGNKRCEVKKLTGFDVSGQVSQGQDSEVTETSSYSYYAAIDGSPTSNHSWWIDRLQETETTRTISYTDGAPVALNTQHVKTKIFWESGTALGRRIDCQFNFDGTLSSPSSCGDNTISPNKQRLSFDYDDRGNRTANRQFGQVGMLSSSDQTRVINTNYQDVLGETLNDGYFPATITQQGPDGLQLMTNHAFDNKNGLVVGTTDPNGIYTENTYDAFGYQTRQSVYKGGAFAQPVETAYRACGNGCATEQNVINGIIDNLSGQLGYSGFFVNGTAKHYPKLAFKSETAQLGSPTVTQWLDFKGQPILSRTTTSGGEAYTLTLTNPVGNVEVTSMPFTLNESNQIVTNDDWYDIHDIGKTTRPTPYVTIQNYDDRGRLVGKAQEVGFLGVHTANQSSQCVRNTTYTHQGRFTQVSVSANNTSLCPGDVTSLSMWRYFDASGRVRKTQDAMNYQTEYYYSGSGDVAAVIDNAGNTISNSYNKLGRKIEVNDPNMGNKTFAYNSFGELVFEQDAFMFNHGAANYFVLDELGRVSEKYSHAQLDSQTGQFSPAPGNISYHDQNYYDSCFSAENCGAVQGLLTGVVRNSTEYIPGNYSTTYEKTLLYDQQARPIKELVNLPNALEPYASDFSHHTEFFYYHDHNKLKQTIYNDLFSLVNHFTEFGELYQQTDAVTGDVLMHQDDWNYRGSLIHTTFNNNPGMKTQRQYFPGTGQVRSITNFHTSSGVQQWHIYDYDMWGNVIAQELDLNATASGYGNYGNIERLTYDALHRITAARLDNSEAPDTVTQFQYDDDGLGNLVRKTDYTSNIDSIYGTGIAGPNAITRLHLNNGDVLDYEYDNRGNRIADHLNASSSNPETVGLYEYDPFNLMSYGRKTNHQGFQHVWFNYGPDNQRFRKREVSTERNEITIYGGPAYEYVVDVDSGQFESKFHLTDYLTVTRQSAGQFVRHFMQHDRLGSVTQITDDSGNRIHTKGYDMFGKPRDGETWAAMDHPALAFENDINTNGIEINKRGFTGHEHLDSFELIHMNGRMFDFNNGRFMSVDPFIQGDTSQAINPYSYIQNNPLSGIDPTGYKACNVDQTVDECGLENGETADIEDDEGNKIGTLTLSKDGKALTRITNNGKATTTTYSENGVRKMTIIGDQTAMNTLLANAAKDSDSFLAFVANEVMSGAARDRIHGTTMVAISIFDPTEDIRAVYNCAMGDGDCMDAVMAVVSRRIEKSLELVVEVKKAAKGDIGCNCLVAGTEVATQDGMVAIEDIQVGDEVWAKDTTTGQEDWKTVIGLFTNVEKPIYQINLKTADGTSQVIESTDDHPFFVISKDWIETKDLETGDQISTKTGEPVIVESVVLTNRHDITYNFTVEDFHTYYVTEHGVLVHNCDSRLDGKGRSDKYSSNWASADLENTVTKFVGDNASVRLTNKGKRIYSSPDSSIEIVEDLSGNYFRIHDTSISSKRKYLDLGGSVPNNKTLSNGKKAGRNQSEYNEVTHFKIK